MKKALAILALGVTLVSCGKTEVKLTEETIANRQLPAYCIRDVEFFENEEGRFASIDMPYYQHWKDKVIEQEPTVTSREWYDTQEGIPVCQPNDPRLS